MTDVRKFARFYYDDFIREFPVVYADNDAFATWMRLLVVAEKMWPAVPELPRSVKPRALGRLVDAALLELVPPHSFRIRGFDAERSRRQESARNAAASRWHSKGTADAVLVRREDENEDENKKTPPPPAKRGRRSEGTSPRQRGAAPRANGTNPRANGTSPKQVQKAEKRAGFTPSLANLLERANAAGRR